MGFASQKLVLKSPKTEILQYFVSQAKEASKLNPICLKNFIDGFVRWRSFSTGDFFFFGKTLEIFIFFKENFMQKIQSTFFEKILLVF